MNCRKGDLAIVIDGARAGIVVRCVAFLGKVGGRIDCWLVEYGEPPPPPAKGWSCEDARLRPIRPEPDPLEYQRTESTT